MKNSHSSIAKNSLFNVMGWLIPIILNFISIPIIVKQLGYDQYGIWVLVMAVMGYFALLDLGVAKGGIRFIAEFNASDKTDKVNEVISLCFFIYLTIGVIGCFIIFIITDPILLTLIKLPNSLKDLARLVLYIAAFGFLATMVQTYMLSLPQAFHRFDVSNKIDAATQVLVTTATLIALFLGHGLLGVITIRIAGSIVCSTCIYLSLKRIMPDFFVLRRINFSLAKKVISYSVITFIGRLGSMTANHLQTIVVGTILNTAAMTIFSIPFQLIRRVMGISARIAMVIFPISSELGSVNNAISDRFYNIYFSMTRYLFYLNVVQIVMFSLFSWDILNVWMGKDFADEASMILRLIAIGYFFDTLTNLPSQVCDGLNHPKITSTFALLRGIIGIFFTLVGGYSAGVIGVAAGYMVSCIITSFLFVLYVHPRIIRISVIKLFVTSCAETLICGLLVIGFYLLVNSLDIHFVHVYWALGIKVLVICLILLSFGYFRILDSEKRIQLNAKIGMYLNRAAIIR